MGVVRILSGSVHFSAIDYNFQRVSNNEAKLIAINNIDGSMLNKICSSSLHNYFNVWNSKNRRVRNMQFHCTISVRNQELNDKQLRFIANEWLERMGYGQVPSLIFFHHNTSNNHIHIVTTRIGKDGKKIDDRYEKIRAVRFLDQIMGVNRVEQFRNSVASYLQFSFSNVNQFIALLEQNGFVISTSMPDGKYLTIQRNGLFVCKLEYSLIERCSIRYKKKLEDSIRNKYRAVLIKYAQQVKSLKDLNSSLRKNLGLSLIMHGGKNGKPFYGYTLIDYKNRAVYKGGEFLNVRFLSDLIDKQTGSLDTNNFINDLLVYNKKITKAAINKELRCIGIRIKDNVIVQSGGNIIGEVSDELMQRIRYNDLLAFCNEKYSPVTKGEAYWIEKHYHVNAADFFDSFDLNNLSRKDSVKYYSDMMNSYLSCDNFRFNLRQAGISYFLNEAGEILFYDENRDSVISSCLFSTELQSELSSRLSHSAATFYHSEDLQYPDDLSCDSIKELSSGLMPCAQVSIGGGSSDRPRKKKKR